MKEVNGWCSACLGRNYVELELSLEQIQLRRPARRFLSDLDFDKQKYSDNHITLSAINYFLFLFSVEKPVRMMEERILSKQKGNPIFSFQIEFHHSSMAVLTEDVLILPKVSQVPVQGVQGGDYTENIEYRVSQKKGD